MKKIALLTLFTAGLTACVSAGPINVGGNLRALQLNATQQANLRTLMGLTASSPFTIQVLDKDSNSALNAGDLAVMKGGVANREISRRVLTAADVSKINANPNANTGDDFMRRLNAAQAKWRQLRPVHYTYTLQRSCFCTPDVTKPLDIRVYEGVVQQVTIVPDNKPLPKSRRDEAKTIDQLFRLIREAVEQNAASIRVEYDNVYGFPTSISIDRDVRIADEEVYYTASNLRPASGLKPRQPRR